MSGQQKLIDVSTHVARPKAASLAKNKKLGKPRLIN